MVKLTRMSSKQSYVKYHVKRDPQSLKFKEDEKGNPVKGDKIRKARITEDQADVLNAHSLTSGHMWVRDKEDEVRIKSEAKEAKKEAKKVEEEAAKRIEEKAAKKADEAAKAEAIKEVEEEAAEKAEKAEAKKVEETEVERTKLLAEVQVLVSAGKIDKMPNKLMGAVKLKELIAKNQ